MGETETTFKSNLFNEDATEVDATVENGLVKYSEGQCR